MAKQEEVLKSIGENLKKAREAKGLTIEQANIKTRIHTKVLAALEDGRIDSMLSLVYARGFLKKYSAFLGLNSEEVVKGYLAVHEGHREPRREEFKESPVKNPVGAIKAQGISFAQDRYIYVVIAILSVAVLFTLASLVKPRHTRQKVRQETRLRKPAQPPPARQAKQPVAKPKMPSSPALSIPKNEPIILTLRVKRPVLVRASEDDGVRFDSVLKEGVVETLKAQDKINLKIGAAEALDLSLNGRPLALNRRGEIKDLEITRRGIRIK